jgi:hypothetical protein
VEVKTLQQHIAVLATLKQTGSPVVSCYLNLASRQPVDELDRRILTLKASFDASEREQVAQALLAIERYLRMRPVNDAASLAMFSRAGKEPFFLPLEFRVPLPTWISVNVTPNIYHLVELKDNYDRYVILFSTEGFARVLGINLGSITQEVWRTRPELRQRTGHEWTREHYQDHRRERTKQFIREQIRIADQLMSTGGYAHLILAGPARLTSGLRQALPKHLLTKLVDVVSASSHDRLPDVVAATLQSFLEYEESESLAIADRLLRQVRTHGLAVVGTSESMTALRAGQVDVLVLAKDYEPGRAWSCPHCGLTRFELPSRSGCPKCQVNELRQVEIKEEMVRLAERLGCGIEVVEHSDPLMQLGGVGCLLRYAAPANYRQVAA